MLHFVGHRKKALRLVHQAYMQGGLQGAYQLLSVLPHSEQDYAELDIPRPGGLPAASTGCRGRLNRP